MIEFHYLHDSDVDAELDRRVRELLCRCFRKPEDAVFQSQRFFKEMPAHRFLWFGQAGDLLGHIALHDKLVTFGDDPIAVGGVAEVCTHPDHRGQGAVRAGLGQAHDWLRGRGVPIAMLFGEREIYASSGYSRLADPVRHLDLETSTWQVRRMDLALAAPLLGQPIPKGPIDLAGPTW